MNSQPSGGHGEGRESVSPRRTRSVFSLSPLRDDWLPERLLSTYFQPRKIRSESWFSLWFDFTCSETQGKVPKSHGPSACLLPPVLSSHKLDPAGSLGLPATLPSLQICSPLLRPQPSVPDVACSLHCCGQLPPGGIVGIKTHLPGAGLEVLSPGCCPAPLHWICKKCQAAAGTLPRSKSLCRFRCSISSGHLPRSLGGWDFDICDQDIHWTRKGSQGNVELYGGFIVTMRIFSFFSLSYSFD